MAGSISTGGAVWEDKSGSFSAVPHLCSLLSAFSCTVQGSHPWERRSTSYLPRRPLQAAAVLPERKAEERGGRAHRILTSEAAALSAVENWTSCEHSFMLLGWRNALARCRTWQ